MADPVVLYAQLLGLGLPWTLVHCGGMCGPLVAAFRFGERAVPAVGPVRRPWLAIVDLLAYQGGRVLGLATMGAGAGWAGAALAVQLAGWAPWLAVGLGGVFLIVALAQLGLVRFAGLGRWLDGAGAPQRLVQLAADLRRRRPMAGNVALGLALSLLPCGVVAWGLGLAAASGSALHGAALLAILVAMTTPVLAVVAAGSSLIAPGLRQRLARWLPPLAWAFSGAWLLTIGLLRLHADPMVC
jgi:sulfite exporter TauE/SafE